MVRTIEMQKYLSLSYLSSISALGVATCCILPMAMMFLGLGGSWLAVFGKIAATSYYVLAISSVLVGTSWLIALRRRKLARLKWWMSGSTAMTVLAWIVVINETRINDYLIMRM
jgi:hypothetical protein